MTKGQKTLVTVMTLPYLLPAAALFSDMLRLDYAGQRFGVWLLVASPVVVAAVLLRVTRKKTPTRILGAVTVLALPLLLVAVVKVFGNTVTSKHDLERGNPPAAEATF